MKGTPQDAVTYLKLKGLSAVGAAAVTGSCMIESGLNTRAVGDRTLKDKAYGLAQWRGKRWAYLQEFAKEHDADVYDFHLQMNFLMYEMATTEAEAGKQLHNATTLSEAINAMVNYERPLGWVPNHPERAKTWRVRFNAASTLLKGEQV